MSQLKESRNFFKNYEGNTVEVEAKYAKFVFFASGVELSDLLDYQASIDEIELMGNASEVTAQIILDNMGEPFTVSMVKQLSRRFKDDRRNWENRAGAPNKSASSVMRQLTADALEGTPEEQTAFLASLKLWGMGNTKEYQSVAGALKAQTETEGNTDVEPDVDSDGSTEGDTDPDSDGS